MNLFGSQISPQSLHNLKFSLILALVIFLNSGKSTEASTSNQTNKNENSKIYLEDSDSASSSNVDNDNNGLSTTSRTAFRVTTSFSSSLSDSSKRDGAVDSSDILPLEKLFSQMTTPNNESSTTPASNNSETESELNTRLSSRLLNHSILHGSDDELDRLVFSQLPEGSKLVLRTVKIVKTDENGNEESMGDPAVSWNVVPINSTMGEEPDEELEDYEDGEEEEEEDNDLDQAGSHPKTSEYSTYGSNEKKKSKKDKHFYGQDHGKEHKITNTDTDGKEVTNYKGTEKGLTDFAKSHGNSQSNEGERYKNSKKKNKGRKVTGFKRVYHKEEFQRTEHFYDDEQAAKLSEKFRLADSVEAAKHGVKDDDTKYKGTRVEKTDGEKVKNEHSTKNGHHKGQQTVYKDSDEHKQNSHYKTAQQSQSPHYQNNHHTNNYYSPPNYQGAYSIQRPAPAVGIRTHGHGSELRPHSVRSVSPEAPLPITTISTGDDNSQFDHLRTMFPPPPPTNEYRSHGPVYVPIPNEMKVFFAERERRTMPSTIEPHYYAPNFGPDTPENEKAESAPEDHDNNDVSEFYSKIGETNSSGFVTPLPKKIRHNVENSQGDSAIPLIPPPLFDAIPEYYSTILKMKTNPNLGSVTFVNYRPESNLISIEKAKSIEQAVETVPQYSRPESLYLGNKYSNWIPLGAESSNTEKTADLSAAGNNTSFESTEIIETVGSVDSAKNEPKFPKEVKHLKEIPDLTVVSMPHGYPGRRRPKFTIPFRHNPGPGPIPIMRGKGHYYGRTIGPNQNNRVPPSNPTFMNGIMSSMSEFFNRIGK